jgi:hypothetical protein
MACGLVQKGPERSVKFGRQPGREHLMAILWNPVSKLLKRRD